MNPDLFEIPLQEPVTVFGVAATLFLPNPERLGRFLAQVPADLVLEPSRTEIDRPQAVGE